MPDAQEVSPLSRSGFSVCSNEFICSPQLLSLNCRISRLWFLLLQNDMLALIRISERRDL
jgi:hypothetical protein